MKYQGLAIVIVAAFMAHEASAADLGAWRTSRVSGATQVVRTAPVAPERAVARLVDQGLGYSVLHETVGAPQQSYRVHVTCTLTETFAQTYCPTPAYESHCPSATIICR
jgi:hypothetical protein